ncbi:hypothetical protein [Nostoc sp. PCC 9305]|uniref:hypothetical protein n=1 Tax=Nostoc sp. PCC 9305 TaxID=296636 RepID=UPI0039C75A74
MSRPRKKQGNPDFRHWVTCPAPTNQQIESRLIELLSPGTFANLKDVKDKERNLRRRSPHFSTFAQRVADRRSV